MSIGSVLKAKITQYAEAIHALSSGGVLIGARPDGFLRVQIDPTTLLFDTFETLDTTNTWTTGGTNTPTATGGNLIMNVPAATLSATGWLVSKAAFVPGSSAYLQFASVIQLEAGSVTNTERWFGLGVVTTPTSSLPITNGAIFELDPTGNLWASVYSNSVRTQATQLTKPVDGAQHRYSLYYKGSRVYYEIDNVPVASLAFPNPTVGSLYVVAGQANSGTAVVGTPVFNISLLDLADTARNATKVADGKYPWRTQTVSSTGSAQVQFDPASSGFPDGSLRDIHSTVISDGFDSLDTSTWTTGGVAPTISANGLLISTVTKTASASSYLYSAGVFKTPSTGFLVFTAILALPSVYDSSTFEWFGFLSSLAPTNIGGVSAFSDGIAFRRSGANFGLALIIGGTEYNIVNFARPNDGGLHKYSLYVNDSKAYAEIDGVAVGNVNMFIAGNATFPINTLVAHLGVVSGFGAPTQVPLINVNSVGVADSGRSFVQMADGAYPWRRASVGLNGGLSIKGATSAPYNGSLSTTALSTAGPVFVGESGNVTFTFKQSIGPWSGSPVIVFEQSDDNYAWGPLNVTRSSDGQTNTSFIIPTPTATGSIMFDAAVEGATYVRVRNTNTTGGSFPINFDISPGGLAFSPSVSVMQPARSLIAIYGYQLAGLTTEGLFTVGRIADGGSTVSTTTFTVTTGKRFRIQSIKINVKNTAAAAGTSKIVIRYNGAGGALSTVTSSWLLAFDLGSNNAVANNYFPEVFETFPDGIELVSGSTFGIYNLSNATTLLHTINIIGYEY